MRFSLQLHGSLPLDAYPALGRAVEQMGFDDVTVHDVLMRRPVWPLLCDLARATETVQVGPNVTHPHLQHPALIASNIAHLDDVSGGRSVLGIGRGTLYQLVGRSMPKGYESLREAVEIIRALLAHDADGVSGETFALAPGVQLAFGEPRSVPVCLGVIGPRGAELAGEIADGVRAGAQWDPSWMLEFRPLLHEAAERAGRSPEEVPLTVENWTYLHPDRELARHGARRLLANFLPVLGILHEFYAIPSEEIDAAVAASRGGDPDAADRISDTTVDRFMCAGDAGDLRRGLDAWHDAGFDSISFSGVLGPDLDLALRMIGDEVAERSDRVALRAHGHQIPLPGLGPDDGVRPAPGRIVAA